MCGNQVWPTCARPGTDQAGHARPNADGPLDFSACQGDNQCDMMDEINLGEVYKFLFGQFTPGANKTEICGFSGKPMEAAQLLLVIRPDHAYQYSSAIPKCGVLRILA